MRGRFAPSPTGRMHLGNARTALLAWLQVRAAGGRFVLRIEDLDPERCSPEHERALLDDLRWLGLDWDEGPDIGGPHAPYRQSQRFELYAATAARLETFACTCTRRELREATLAPHGSEPVYPGTCRARPPRRGRPAALRWSIPPGRVGFVDGLYGEVAQDMAEVGAFVLRRSDGAWAYQLAVVADDAAMGIDCVLRGADLLGSTARQIHLQRALELPTPSYLHVPLMIGGDGEKLAKRHGAPDLGELRDSGCDPRRVVAALARSAGLLETDVAGLAASELISSWDPERLRRDSTAIASAHELAGLGVAAHRP